ncbi:MAG: acetylxylan esterase [Planctomycetes bacterium]|nr:acetylxylan esterase [Planctomycetota bacterium]
MNRPSRSGWVVSLIIVSVLGAAITAMQQRVVQAGTIPNDSRLGELNHLNGYFPFHVPSSRASWEKRSRMLKRRILVATGLWPLPEKTPLRAVIHGKTKRDGFTVEKVYFQSYPGHFVTGLLFRPEGEAQKRPAVLCPHGHGGRLQNHGDEIQDLIASGDERYEKSGRTPKLARCAQLARMGCVTFIYDMEGYADSVQLGMTVAHRLSDARPHMEKKDSWGFFSTQAELRNQNIMGLQTWNMIRALDFLCSLPEVDPQKVGVTGGSGGGTQTILLGAIDPRPVVSFPNGMVSTAMQGGCICENANLLRINSGNVELAGLFAPKPLAMTGADDWTRDIQTKGYPELQKLYSLYGVKERVYSKELLQFKHNYNYVSRSVMYAWFNTHLQLGLTDALEEKDWEPLTDEQLNVWNDEHPAPAGGEQYERQLLKQMDVMSQKSIRKQLQESDDRAQTFHDLFGEAIRTTVGRDLPAGSDISRQKISKTDRGDYLEFIDLLRYMPGGEEIPVLSFTSKKVPWNKKVVIWIDGDGKQSLYSSEGIRSEVNELLNKGYAVVSADMLYQGDFLGDGEPITKQREVEQEREIAAYTYTYNNSLFVQRVHDVLTLIAFVHNDEHEAETISLVGTNGAGPIAAVARMISGDVVAHAVIDTGGFRFKDLTSWRDPSFFPGAVRYGDVPGLLGLNSPQALCVLGEGNSLPEWTRSAYDWSKAEGAVVTRSSLQAALDWLK